MLFSILIVATISLFIESLYTVIIYWKFKTEKLTYYDYESKLNKVTPTLYLTLLFMMIITVILMSQ
ncbi:hypothetical protein ABLV92_08305 [Staphylococcus equorum]